MLLHDFGGERKLTEGSFAKPLKTAGLGSYKINTGLKAGANDMTQDNPAPTAGGARLCRAH